jgi:hypothetical protein
VLRRRISIPIGQTGNFPVANMVEPPAPVWIGVDWKLSA